LDLGVPLPPVKIRALFNYMFLGNLEDDSCNMLIWGSSKHWGWISQHPLTSYLTIPSGHQGFDPSLVSIEVIAPVKYIYIIIYIIIYILYPH
jgi:hypothetical protein